MCRAFTNDTDSSVASVMLTLNYNLIFITLNLIIGNFCKERQQHIEYEIINCIFAAETAQIATSNRKT